MVPPIVGYPCPLRTRPVKHTVSGSCRPRERALDTPENRFVKTFIGQSKTIIGRMRSAVGSSQPNAFRRNVLRDCDRMEASLMPITRQGVGAIPLAPVVGDTTDHGQGQADASVDTLRQTLKRTLGVGG